MGDMTRAQYARRVLKALGNIPDSHPAVTDGALFDAINNAPNRLIRENPDMFPEHMGRTWTYGPTVAGDDRISFALMPRNLHILQKITTNRSATAPAADWVDTQEFQISIPNNVESILGQLSRTATGYPSMAGRKAQEIVYWPRVAVGYECYLRLHGTSLELPLQADGDTFWMRAEFDQTIVLVAASELAELIQGKEQRSVDLLQMAGGRVKTVGRAARERAQQPLRAKIAGMPGGRY